MQQIALDETHILSSYPTNSLSLSEYGKCVEKIRSLYLWFAPSSTEDDISQRLHRHTETHLDIITLQTSCECVGFSVYHTESLGDRKVMFRGGTVIRDRSQGLYKKFLSLSIDLKNPHFLVAMTQNPRVYETLRSFSPDACAYPSLGRTPPEEIQYIARHFCNVSGFDPVSMRIPDVYKSIRKEDSFRTVRDPVIAEMFAKLPENDGFFVVVPLM